MNITKVEFRPWIPTSRYPKFSTQYLSVLFTVTGLDPVPMYYSYWYVQYKNGVQYGKPLKGQMYRPSQTSTTSGILSAFMDYTDQDTCHFRVYQEDPTLNPSAEWVVTDTVKFLDIIAITDAPIFQLVPASDINLNYDSMTIMPRSTTWDSLTNYYSIETIKIYEEETGFVLFDDTIGQEQLVGNAQITLNYMSIPPDHHKLKTVLAELKIKNLLDASDVHTLTSYLGHDIRYIGNDISEITSYNPFVTALGNPTLKYPSSTLQTQMNYYGTITSSPLINTIYTETNPAYSWYPADAAYNAPTAYTSYINGTTDYQLNTSSNLSFDLNDESTNAETHISNLAASEEVKPGDLVKRNVVLSNPYGHVDSIDLPTMTAVNCTINQLPKSTFPILSMPPLDVSKPYYDLKLYDPATITDDFILFGTFQGPAGRPVYIGNGVVRYIQDLSTVLNNPFQYYVSSPAKWYVNKNLVEAYYEPQMMSEIYVAPLIKTGGEKITISTVSEIAAGEKIEIISNVENAIIEQVASVDYVWKKDGVVLTNQVGNTLTIDSASADNNGTYTVDYTMWPATPHATDSFIKITSNPFVLDVPTENELTMSVLVDNPSATLGSSVVIMGSVTIPTNTISKCVLMHGTTVVEEWGKALTYSHTIASVTEADLGAYHFEVTYTDGPATRTYISEIVTVSLSANPNISFTVSTIIVPVAEGSSTALLGTVNATNPTSGIVYEYQWYKDGAGIVGATNKDLYITNASYANDSGSYKLSVTASATGFSATTKQTIAKTLVVKRNPHLSLKIIPESFVVADGKANTIYFSFVSDYHPINLSWEWYANGVKLDGLSNASIINPVDVGDTIYYVIAKSTDEQYINDYVQSNIVNIKGVTAVEDLTLALDGPNAAKLGDRVTFHADLSLTDSTRDSNTLDVDNYTYEWYRGTTILGTGASIRVYAAKDAGGTYTYKIFSKIDPTISRVSPAHVFTVADVTPIDVKLPANQIYKTGTSINIVSTVTPSEGATYQWYKNGAEVVGQTNKNFTKANSEPSDTGSYTLKVTISGDSNVSSPCIVTVSDNPTPQPPVSDDVYIHDLRPGRDRGFLWMGWWILDEIQRAKNDGFNWIADPTNARFEYPRVLVALSKNVNTWEDIEIQESRNGYILLLSELK